MSGLGRSGRERVKARTLPNTMVSMPVSGERIAQDLSDQPPAAHLARQRDARRIEPPARRAGVVVSQVLAHAGQGVDHFDAVLAQHVGIADTRQLQQLGRVGGAAGHDHLTPRAHFVRGAVAHVAYADATLALHQQRGRFGAGHDREVRPPACRRNVVRRGAAALPAVDRLLGEGDALLRLAAVVGRARDARRVGRTNVQVEEARDALRLGHLDGAVAAAKAVGTDRRAFDRLEVWQHVLVGPARAPQAGPIVVVAALAAVEHHAVDRCGAAQHLASRDVHAPVAVAWIGLRVVAPVHLRVAEHEQAAGGRTRPEVPLVGRAGFQAQHPVPAVLAQARGDYAATGPRADHDVVVDGAVLRWTTHLRDQATSWNAKRSPRQVMVASLPMPHVPRSRTIGIDAIIVFRDSAALSRNRVPEWSIKCIDDDSQPLTSAPSCPRSG